MSEEVKLPYFDVVFASKDRESKMLERSLNMHWAYWEDPSKAFTNEENKFIKATENLSRLIYEIVEIKEGYKVADVGCGFGGTIDLMNKNFSNIDMAGINIDPRQVEAAKERVKADNGNKIEFITGDACDLPFENESIDALVAVECIFHFPDRAKFFSEVNRVLKPGAKFAFSDFIPVKEEASHNGLIRNTFKAIVKKHYGSSSPALTLNQYNEIAERCNLKNICTLDINTNVLPTYKAIYYIIDHAPANKGKIKFFKKLPTRFLELSQRIRQVLYMVVGYQKL